jgi:hypothetical protein
MSDKIPRPTKNDDRDAWRAYWQVQSMPWRTEPEVNEERQAYLAERRAVEPDIEQGIYPFTDVKLDRADVEWLLATHESDGMQGPVDWSDQRQQTRAGLDLRGAVLANIESTGKRKADRSVPLDLSDLPLAGLRAGAPFDPACKVSPRNRSSGVLFVFWLLATLVSPRSPHP